MDIDRGTRRKRKVKPGHARATSDRWKPLDFPPARVSEENRLCPMSD
jgi:hypothetical protein